MYSADFPGCTVRVAQGEPIDFALRKFKKAVEKTNVLRDARRKEFHVPRSERLRAKSAAARKRQGLT